MVTLKRFKPGPNPKFSSHWSGIFRIVELDDNQHAKISSLYNPTAPLKKVHVDQIKAYYRPPGEPAITDVNFDVDKHITENVIRKEDTQNPDPESQGSNEPGTSQKTVNEQQISTDFIPKPLEEDLFETQNEVETETGSSTQKLTPKAKQANHREQVLKRYSTISVPKQAHTTRSGRTIRSPEKLNLFCAKQ